MKVARTFIVFILAFALYAQEVLNNDTILKLVKAGLNDDVIAGMVNSQPGKYSLDSDAVIALKQGGVSDKVITAMVTKDSVVSPPVSHGLQTTASTQMVIHDGTPVRMRLNRNLSSADAKTGDTIDFEVLDEVEAGDVVVIARGATAIGSVTEAETDAEVKQAIIDESRASYRGSCPCPYDSDRAGRRCGARSAYSRPGGASPVCYEKDVTPRMVDEYRRRTGQ